MKILIFGTGKSVTTAISYAVKECFKNRDYPIIFEPQTLSSINYTKDDFIVKSLNIVHNSLYKDKQSYISRFDKRVLIVRHIFDTIVSFLLYKPFKRPQFEKDSYVKDYVDILKRKTECSDSVFLEKVLNVY